MALDETSGLFQVHDRLVDQSEPECESAQERVGICKPRSDVEPACQLEEFCRVLSAVLVESARRFDLSQISECMGNVPFRLACKPEPFRGIRVCGEPVPGAVTQIASELKGRHEEAGRLKGHEPRR